MAIMLLRDDAMFRAIHPKAVAFFEEAVLRMECYLLAIARDRTPTQCSNLKWHLHSPACKEPWFLDLLEHDGYEMETL